MSADWDELDRFLVDGGVLVPVELVGELLGRLRPLVTMPGPRLTRDMVELLQALGRADLEHMSARGPAAGAAEIVDPEGSWVSTSAAARRVGCSARHIRRLAEQSALRAKLVGRDWLINLPSLDQYFRRTRDDRSAGRAS